MKTYNKADELNNCVFVKTVLMIIVVAYHCMLFWSGSWFVGKPAYPSNFLGLLSAWMNSFHIYGFTLVSGYLFYYLRYEAGKYQMYSSFVLNKVKRLLVPYVFVSIAWVIPVSQMFFQYSPTEIVKKFALGTAPGQLWFLIMLFGVFVLFFPLSNYLKEKNIKGAIIVVLFYALGLLGHLLATNYFQVFSAFTYMPFFWIGFKIRQYGSQFLRKIPCSLWLLSNILLFTVVRLVTKEDGYLFLLLMLGFEFLLNIHGAVMTFIVLQKIAERIHWQKNKAFHILTTCAMPIYLFHQQIIYFFLYLFNGKLHPFVHVAVNFIGVMVISLLLSKLLIRFQITKALLGEK